MLERAGALVGIVLGLLAATASAGQPQPEIRWLGIQSVSGDLDLRYESQDRVRTEKASGARTRFGLSRLEEVLGLTFKGYVYHPRFLEFSAMVGVDLEQGDVRFDTPGERLRRSYSSAWPQYRISGIFLSHQPVTLTFGLEKSRTTVAPEFADIAVVDTESQRARIFVKSEPFPAELYYTHSLTDHRQLGIGVSRRSDITTRGFTVNHTTDRSTTTLSYENQDSREDVAQVSAVTTQFVTEQKVNDLSLSNQLRFGDAAVHALNSRVSYRDDTGTFPTSRFAIDEALHLWHAKSLSSDYGLLYSRETIASRQVERLGGRASLSHRLFESLFTTLEAHASGETFDGSSRDIQGASLSVQYRKHIPHGILLLDLGTGYEVTDEKNSGDLRPVADESHVLSNVITTYLTNLDVVDSSIRVTDVAKTITYLRDFDYRIIPVGRLTEIRRLTSGTIPDGGTVLVNYSFNTGASITYATKTWRARAQVDLFKCLSLYAGVRDSKQSLLAGTDAGRLQSIRDTVYGASLRWGPATLSAEHEDYNSTLAPFKSDRVSLDVNHSVGQVHHLSASATARRVSFPEQGKSTYQSVSGTYRFTSKYGLSLRATLGSEKSDDRGFSGTYAFARLEAAYKIRATEISLGYWLNNRDDDFARDLSHYVFIKLHRSF